MADKQISELTQVGALASDGLFVVQQDGQAYRAAAAQVAALSGGGSGGGTTGGESAYILDLTAQVEVDSDPRSVDDRAQGFDLSIDAAALLAATGRIQIKYKDIRFDDQVHTATFDQRMVDDAAAEGDTYMRLYATILNPWWGTASAFELEINVTADGYEARLAYWPFAQAQADFEETDKWLPGYLKNSPITISDGYTDVANQRKLTNVDVTETDTGATIALTFDGGVTDKLTLTNTDTGVTITDAEGHVTTVTGVTI